MSGPEATGRTVVAFGELLPLEEADRDRRLAEIAVRDPSWAATLRGLFAAPATGRLRPLTRLAADDETGPSLAGLELGTFRLVEPIAAGGMGEVWRARQERPDREVAVKVIRRSLADDRLREADLLGRLRHPSLATVHASGVAATPRGEFAWIAMELIEGGRDLVTGLSGLPLDRRLALFAQAAEGVAFAHSHGVLHRDLKPSNILLDREGRPKVIDFGIARFTDADLRSIAPDATAADFPAGTPAYLAPEAFDAGLGRIDARGDVYSLGVILHQVAFGSLPTGLRAASPLAVLEAARTASFEPPPGTPRSLRGDLAAIVRRATARDPERRYPTVEALVADVRNFLARRPVTARPRGTAGAMTLAFRRQPLVASLAAALVLLLVVATAVSAAFAIRAGRSLETARIAAERRDALIAALNTAIGLEDDRWTPDPDLSMREFLRQRVVAIAEDAARGPYQVKLDAWIPALETLEIVMVRLGLAEDALVAAELHEDLVQLRAKGRPWSGHLGEFRRLIARAATDPSDSTAVEAMRAMVPVMLRSQAISRASDTANLLDVDLAATPRVNFLVADAIESSPGAVDDPEAIYAAGYLRILALRKLFTLDEPVPPDEFRAAAATLLDPQARAAAGFQPDLRVWVLQLTLAIAERDGLVRQPELAGDFVRLCLAAPFVSGRPGVIAATLQRLVEREEWTAAGSLLAAIERHGGTESPECLAERLMLDRCRATIDRRAGRLVEGLALLQHAGDLEPSEITDVRTGREHARTLGLAARLAIEAGCEERASRFREALARNEAAFRDGTSIVRSDPYRDELAAIDLVHPMPAAP